jgi:hypothetical protein
MFLLSLYSFISFSLMAEIIPLGFVLGPGYLASLALLFLFLFASLYALIALWSFFGKWLLPYTDASRSSSNTLRFHSLFSSLTFSQTALFMLSFLLLAYYAHLTNPTLLLNGVLFESFFIGGFAVQAAFKSRVLGLKYDTIGLVSPYCGAAYAKAAICMASNDPEKALDCLRIAVYMAAKVLRKSSQMFSDRLLRRVLLKIEAEKNLSPRPNFTHFCDLANALARWDFKRISRTSKELVQDKSLAWSDPYLVRSSGIGIGYVRYLVKAGSVAYVLALGVGAVGAAFLSESVKSDVISAAASFVSSGIAIEYFDAIVGAALLLILIPLFATYASLWIDLDSRHIYPRIDRNYSRFPSQPQTK